MTDYKEGLGVDNESQPVRGTENYAPSAEQELYQNTGEVRSPGMSRTVKRVIAGVALAATAGVGGVIVYSVNESNAQAERVEQSKKMAEQARAKVEAMPTEIANPEQFITPASQIEIEAGLDNATYTREFLDRLNMWINEGGSLDLADRYDDVNAGWDSILTQVTEANKKAYADSLLIKDWQNKPELVEWVNQMAQSNYATLHRYIRTAWNKDEHPENIEPYKHTRELDEFFVDQPRKGVNKALDIVYFNKNNSDKNMFGQIDKPMARISGIKVWTAVEGDKEKVYSAGQRKITTELAKRG